MKKQAILISFSKRKPKEVLNRTNAAIPIKNRFQLNFAINKIRNKQSRKRKHRPAAGDDLSDAFVGDDEGEYGEAKEKHDEDEHDEEVDPEEARLPAAGADEPRKRNQQQEDSQRDHRPLKELLAVGGAAVAQPDPSNQNRNGEEEDEEVEKPYQAVAELHHCGTSERRGGRRREEKRERRQEDFI